MQKTLVAAALALIAAPSAVHAQAVGQIGASATIAEVVAFDNTSASNINFGTLTPDLSTNPTASGYIPVRHNVAVQVWFVGTPDLQIGTTGTKLTTTYECGVNNAAVAPSAWGTCPTAQAGGLTPTYDGVTGGVQLNYVHVKASLSATQVNTAAPGVYSGTVELRAAKSTI